MNLQDIAKKVDLAKELELDKLSEEERASALEQIGQIVYERVILRFLEELKKREVSEAVRIEFLKLAEAEGKEEQLKSFLKGFLPDADELVMDEIGKYKQEMVTFMKEAREEEASESKPKTDADEVMQMAAKAKQEAE